MAVLPFTPDRKLTDVLAEHVFTLSAEIIPPRNGTEQQQVMEQIQKLIQGGAQFLAVTKGAGGSLRGGSLPIAQAIKEQFRVPCIAHFTCRDLTAHEVENQLMDHHYFGIRNILALRGDPPDGQPGWKPRPDGYTYAHELIAQIRGMNQGRYLPRPGGPESTSSERTDFCIGAAVYPEHPDERERLEFFRLKVLAGAEYGISQILFDPDAYARFLELCTRHQVGVPILPGTRVLKSRAQALRMAQKFGVSAPEWLLKRLPEQAEGLTDAALEAFLELVARLRAAGAPGIHLYVIADAESSRVALQSLSATR